MDFSQFLLNESFILSPYKICVASFIYSCLDFKQWYTIPDDLDYSFSEITAIGYLTYKLIISMDCSYKDFINNINNININHCSKIAVIQKSILIEIFKSFTKEVNRLRHSDIRHLYDLFDKFRLLLQKKIKLQSKQSDDMNTTDQQLNTMDLASTVHKMSLLGIFLRKLIIYFDRLSYSEASILFDQLHVYLSTSIEFDLNRDKNENKVMDENCKHEDLNNKININNLNKLESKLNIRYPSCHNLTYELFYRQLYRLIQIAKVELNLDLKEDLSDGNYDNENQDTDSKNSDLMDIDNGSLAHYAQSENIASTSSAMDITLNDDGTNNVETMALEKTFNRNKKTFEISAKDDTFEKCQKVSFVKIPEKYQSDNSCTYFQNYYIKQIYKIQYNEKTALPPQKMMFYIQKKFNQHNAFNYIRYINFNYLANLNLVCDQSGLESLATYGGNGSAFFLMNNDNQANSLPINIGSNAINSGSSALSSIAIDSLNTKYKSLFRTIQFFNDIEYLKFLNALRVNNYTLARKAFFDYFDLKKLSFFNEENNFNSFSPASNSAMMNGNIHNNMSGGANISQRLDGNTNLDPVAGYGGTTESGNRTENRSVTMALNSNNSNYCWSALNLAMMYAHFGYYRLAYDALVDCLSLARKKRDEHCLQYAMLWILQISQHLDHSKSKRLTNIVDNEKVYSDVELMENIIGLILNNHYTLPYISAKTFLHLSRLQYLKPILFNCQQISLFDITDKYVKRQQLLPQPFYLAIQNRLYDVLGETYTTYAAILNAYGASHLASTYSKLWLRMDVTETIMEERVFLLNENTSIAVRNLAQYVWQFQGNYCLAIKLIEKFQEKFSIYNQIPTKLLERALIEIMFDQYINTEDWNLAAKCLNKIRCIDKTWAYLMMAEFRRRQNEHLSALECLDLINRSNKHFNNAISKLSGKMFFRQNPFYSSTNFNDNKEEYVIAQKVKKNENKSNNFEQELNIPIDYNLIQTSSKPIHLSNYQSTNLNFYERIQPPPPEELEPIVERPLVSELDPYTAVKCLLLRGKILQDFSLLFECIAKSIAHGFKLLECQALIQVAKLQTDVYGQHVDAAQIMKSIFHRLFSQEILPDLANGLYIYALIMYRIHRQTYKLNNQTDYNETIKKRKVLSELKLANIYVKRSILIFEHIQDKKGIYDSLRLAALIEHDKQNWKERNFYAKQARKIYPKQNNKS